MTKGQPISFRAAMPAVLCPDLIWKINLGSLDVMSYFTHKAYFYKKFHSARVNAAVKTQQNGLVGLRCISQHLYGGSNILIHYSVPTEFISEEMTGCDMELMDRPVQAQPRRERRIPFPSPFQFFRALNLPSEQLEQLKVQIITPSPPLPLSVCVCLSSHASTPLQSFCTSLKLSAS